MDIYIIHGVFQISCILQGVLEQLYFTGCSRISTYYRVFQNICTYITLCSRILSYYGVFQNIYMLRGVPEILEQMYHGKIRNYDKQGGRANDFFTFAKKNLNVFSSVFTPLTFCPWKVAWFVWFVCSRCRCVCERETNIFLVCTSQRLISMHRYFVACRPVVQV